MKIRYLLIVLLIICLPLSASALRIGIYDSSDGLLGGDVEAALGLIVSSAEAEEFLTSVNMERDERAFRIRTGSSVHSALEREGALPSASVFEYTSYREAAPELVAISRTPAYDDFLSKGSEEAARQLIRTSDLDILLYISAEAEGQLVSYGLELFTFDAAYGLDGGIFILSGRPGLFMDILGQLSALLAPEAGFVSVADFPSGTVYLADGEGITFSDGVALLPEGVHVLTADALGYESYETTFEVRKGELTNIVSGMERSAFSPITFQSVPYYALFSYSGLDGVPLPFTLAEAHYPVIATVSAEGFLPSSLQLTEGMALETVRLRPEWMGASDRVSDAKKNMYRSLRNTLFSLGAVAAVSAIEAVYPPADGDNSLLVPVRAVTVGISIISLVDLIHNLGDYYNAARDAYL